MSNADGIFKKVKKNVEDHLDPTVPVTLNTTFEELGADDIDMLYFIMGIEEDLCVIIPDDDMKNFVSVGDVVKYLKDNA